MACLGDGEDGGSHGFIVDQNVTLSRRKRGVPEQLLNGPDVVTALVRLRREVVPKTVRGPRRGKGDLQSAGDVVGADVLADAHR